MRPATSLTRAYFKTNRGRAFFAGLGAHSMLALEYMTTSAVALVLAMGAHAAGWPFARGGSQQLTTALVRYLESLGGKVMTGYLNIAFTVFVMSCVLTLLLLAVSRWLYVLRGKPQEQTPPASGV